MKRCASPVAAETLRRYFAADLDAGEQAELEEHVFACDACAAAFDREGAMASALREQIAPVVSHERLAALARAGLVVKKCVIPPGATVDVVFSSAISLLINALAVDADDAERIDLRITDIEGRALVEVPAVPYDRGSGEVLVACQRHYRDAFPPLGRFELIAVKGGQRTPLGAYLINHSWES